MFNVFYVFMWLSSLLDLNQILDEVDKNKAILLEIWALAINVNNVWDKTGWACLIKIYVMVHSKAKQSFWSYHNRTMSYLCPCWQKLGKTQQTYFWQLFHPFWFGIKKDVIILIYCQHLSSVSTLWWWHVTQYFALFKAMINLLGYIPPCITVSKLIPIFGWWMRWAEIKQRSFPKLRSFSREWQKILHMIHIYITEKLPWSHRTGN